jgi:hypothetical protein
MLVGHKLYKNSKNIKSAFKPFSKAFIHLERITGVSEMPTSYQHALAMRSPTHVTDGKHITIWSQTTSVVSTANRLVAFYEINGGMGVILFFQIRSLNE